MRKTLIVLPALIAILIAPPAFAQNYVLSLGGDGDYVEIADSESLSGDASRVAQNLSPRSESSATEDGLRTYLRTLGLALSVQRCPLHYCATCSSKYHLELTCMENTKARHLGHATSVTSTDRNPR